MKLYSNLKQYLYRKRNRDKAKISSSALINNVVFEGHNTIFSNCKVSDSYIGEGSYISVNCNICGTKIGRYCSIADNVYIVLGKHPISDFISTFPSFYYNTEDQINFTFHKGAPLYRSEQYVNENEQYNVVIGNDVWIGSHVIILGGITIGDGAVIAAGAVVSKNVEPYSVVGGIPAQKIKMRFNQETIDKLKSIKWWNRDFEDIRKNYMEFLNIDSFINNN